MRTNATSSKLPCIHVRAGGDCLESLLPAVFEAALVHSETASRRRPDAATRQADQATSAIIYVSIVVAFYVLIIGVLVGTTLRRRGSLALASEGEGRHLFLWNSKTRTVTPTLAVPPSKIEEAGLLTV